jgi:uncharacterized protein (TIGR01777 family)
MSDINNSLPIARGASIGVTGASGLVGKAVCCALENSGYKVIRFSRGASGSNSNSGTTRTFSLTGPLDFSGIDAVVHLAGENINGLWTSAKKQKIRDSRVTGTRLVVDGIRHAGSVKLLINASAIGFYGFASSGIFDESSPAGSGFLADVCREWEAEAFRAQEFGCRVAVTRLGLVLGNGGALAKMTPVFRAGLGGQLGNGLQWMSAIHVEDIAGICLLLLRRPDLSGVFNAVMPEPFTNKEFTREMACALQRPAVLPVPAFALRLALGALSDLLLGSSRVVPGRLLSEGHKFLFPALRPALEDVFKGTTK